MENSVAPSLTRLLFFLFPFLISVIFQFRFLVTQGFLLFPGDFGQCFFRISQPVFRGTMGGGHYILGRPCAASTALRRRGNAAAGFLRAALLYPARLLDIFTGNPDANGCVSFPDGA